MNTFFSTPRIIFLILPLGVIVLVVTIALQSTSQMPSRPSPSVSFTPASNDPLSSLGPQWTYLRQTVLSDQHQILSQQSGALPTRESVVKVVGKEVELIIDELNLIDRAQFTRMLQESGAVKTSIAGRSGYIVTKTEITGGSGFLLVGENTALLLQSSRSAVWPKTPESEILTYIQTVRVP